MEKLDRVTARLKSTNFTSQEISKSGIKVSGDGKRRTGYELLAFPNVDFGNLILLDKEMDKIGVELRAQVEKDALYATYIERQNRDVEAIKRDEAHEIPPDFDYSKLNGLSNELVGKLGRVRPNTLGQAGRIEGVTPAALTLILASLRKIRRNRTA